jgi:SNF2 family DNA or RNA helicase
LSAIEALMYDFFTVRKVLVIAPKRVADLTWPAEPEQWSHLRRLRVSKVLGTAKQRIRALQAPADIYAINRENVDWLVEHLRKGKDWDFDMVVIDELSSFKSHTSKRFRALRKVRGKISRLVGLTGTPAPNSLLDLWSELYLLDRGLRLGEKITEYRATYFDIEEMHGDVVTKYKPKKGAPRQIYDKISDICISMKAEDYLELPGRLDIVIPVSLPDRVRAAYERLEEDMVVQIGEEELTAVNAPVLSGKLLQFTGGAVYTDKPNYVRIHEEKLDALVELVEEAQGQPVIVFYYYQHELTRIRERLPQAELLGDQASIDKWNRGEIPVLILHPDSAGHGLNLQYGGHIAIWFTLHWKLEAYLQAVRRLDRQGQTQVVRNYILATQGTVEQAVSARLVSKNATQESLLKAVKAWLEPVKRRVAHG